MQTQLRYYLFLTALFLSIFGSVHAAIDPDTTQKLLAEDGKADDSFGRSVSVSRDTAIIGAKYNDGKESKSGSAYVYVRNGDTWILQAKLIADDGANDDRFGETVAISGDTAIIGAYGDDNDNGSDAGSTYIFIRDGDTWTQQAKLIPQDGAADDRFGKYVSVSGDTAIIGAYQDDDNGSNSGSTYIYIRNGTTWAQQAKLTPEDGEAEDWFGHRLSLSGDTAVIGAYGDDDNGSKSGSAYVYVRTGDTWALQAKFIAQDGEAEDCFGRSVFVSSDTAIIGAMGDEDNDSATGSAYIFVRNEDTWTLQTKLLAQDGEADDCFGRSVSVSGETAIIGAVADDDNGLYSGSAYVFIRTGDIWTQQAKFLAQDGESGDSLGRSVAISADTVIIGATGDNDNGSASGSAYVFNTSFLQEEVTHTITAPSDSSVVQGEWLQFNITHTNNSDNEVEYTAQVYLVLPDETVKSGTERSLSLDSQQTKTIDSYLRIPANALTGSYSFGTTITYTESGEIDDDSFNFTVSLGEPALRKSSSAKNSSFILKQVERKNP